MMAGSKQRVNNLEVTRLSDRVSILDPPCVQSLSLSVGNIAKVLLRRLRFHKMVLAVIGGHLPSPLKNWLALDISALPCWALYKLPTLLAAASIFHEEKCAHRFPVAYPS